MQCLIQLHIEVDSEETKEDDFFSLAMIQPQNEGEFTSAKLSLRKFLMVSMSD